MKNNNHSGFLFYLGCLLPLIVWIAVKYFLVVEDRYLPSPRAVLMVFTTIQPSIFFHTAVSLIRFLLGFLFGSFLGIFLGILLYKSNVAYQLLYPTIQSIRSIPPYASIPFFLLWFGFSEIGKVVILVCGITFNLAISSFQSLLSIEERYDFFFKSIGRTARHFTWSFSFPYVMEKILPTLRFSLSTAIGLVVVAEMLGSQMGLGYLIQTSRSTYSMDVIFLAAFIFGIINFVIDKFLILLWKKIVFWKKVQNYYWH